MNKVEETYLYSVMNRGPIKLSRGIEIRSAKSLYLTKEDVLECLKKAHVYRRFANPPGKQELVTTANIDRLHRPTYISEADWKANGNKITNTFIDEFALDEAEPEIINEEPSVEEPEEIINPEPETVEEIEEPEEVAELTSAGVRVDEQETLVDEIVDDNIVPDVAEEIGEIEEVEENVTENEDFKETEITKNEKNVTNEAAESLVEEVNETGVSENSSTNQPRANTVKYDYHKKNKHGNKK